MLRFVIFTIEGERHPLPPSVVDRVPLMVVFSPLPKAPPIALGMITFRGRAIPVVV